MKAAVYYETGGPEVFRYEEVPDPVCRPRGVIVEMAAVGIQGGDTLSRQGGLMAGVPHIVGYQAAGVIREVGAEVSGFRVGQRVVVFTPHGSHAELVSAPATSTHGLPDGLPLDVAACVPIEFGTADDCLFEFGHLQSGESVLVQAGASGVGLAAVQLAKAAGATVYATASSDERVERIGEFGMDHGINYRREDAPARIHELTGGRGVDLVVDPVGGSTLEGSLAALAYRGRIAWVGGAGREIERPDLSPLMQKNATLVGVYLGGEMAVDPERTNRMISSLIERVASGELRMPVDRRFPLRDARGAHEYIESRRAFGRVVLVP